MFFLYVLYIYFFLEPTGAAYVFIKNKLHLKKTEKLLPVLYKKKFIVNNEINAFLPAELDIMAIEPPPVDIIWGRTILYGSNASS
jgi:hypothetical protein